MEDDTIFENRVVQFLEHLTDHERGREYLEHALLDQIVGYAKREGYDFSADEFKHTVRLEICYGIYDIKWPPGRGK